MTATCPHCGGELPEPKVHRSELERQLGGNAGRATDLRNRAKAAEEARVAGPVRLDADFIAWRGFVWGFVRVRKAATCCITGVPIPVGAGAYRQLSEQRDRELRVAAGVWAHL